jgi:hypothetical protein
MDLTLPSAFLAVYVQHRLIFSCHFIFIVATCSDLLCHHQVYRRLWWRSQLLTVMLLCCSYAVASDYFWLCGLTTCFNVGVLEHRGFWWESQKGRDNWQELDVDGSILRWVSDTDSSDSGQGQVEDSYDPQHNPYPQQPAHMMMAVSA